MPSLHSIFDDECASESENEFESDSSENEFESDSSENESASAPFFFKAIQTPSQVFIGYQQDLEKYLTFNDNGGILTLRTCLVTFYGCVDEWSEMYPEETFFSGPASIVKPLGGFFRMTQKMRVQIFDDHVWFSDFFPLFSDAVQIE
jgi:hypothetical protein